MKIAVQTSDLDHTRIDGTRVYLRELLNHLGTLASDQDFILYHQRSFNPDLTPRIYPNYQEKKIPFIIAWMQTRFAWKMFTDKPDKLFLPIQAAPFLLPRTLEVTATIHDLAWKKYPETFSFWDRLKLDCHLRHVVMRADKLIAVSQSTKNDLLYFFPTLNPKKIRVIHHGFSREFFTQKLEDRVIHEGLASLGVLRDQYILYVGALQPRKNLVRVIHAFEKLKTTVPQAKLVLAGEVAWLAEDILLAQKKSIYAEDILLVGRVDFEQLRILYQGARFFAFPSLYEGFGIPILEAFASDTPVLTADNSSLREVAGEAALYCQGEDTHDIASKMQTLWEDTSLRDGFREQGRQRLEVFSWKKCAEDTIDFLLK